MNQKLKLCILRVRIFQYVNVYLDYIFSMLNSEASHVMFAGLGCCGYDGKVSSILCGDTRGLHWGYMGIMEEKMETRDYRVILYIQQKVVFGLSGSGVWVCLDPPIPCILKRGYMWDYIGQYYRG